MKENGLVKKYQKLLKEKERMGQVVKYLVIGLSAEATARNVFGKKMPLMPDKKDYVPIEMEAAITAIRLAMNTPEFMEIYGAVMRSSIMEYYPKAIKKLGEQIDSDQPWVANKASNDIATRYDKVTAKEDGNVITVRVEGMPEIGEPEADEQ